MSFESIDVCELFPYSSLGLLIEMALLVVRTALGTFVALLGSHMIVVEFVEKSSIACCSYRDQLMQKEVGIPLQ